MRGRDRMFGPESKKIKMLKTGTWVRDEKGGFPYEVRGALAKIYQPSFGSAFLFHDSTQWAYNNWHGRVQQIVEAEIVPNGERMEYRKDLYLLVLPHQHFDGEYLVSALANNRPVGLEVTTGKNFNLFDPEKEPVKFSAEICNVTGHNRKGKFRIQNRKDSIMGIAAHFPLPGHPEVYELMQKIGVRWLRTGNTSELKSSGFTCIYSQGPNNSKAMDTREKKKHF